MSYRLLPRSSKSLGVGERVPRIVIMAQMEVRSGKRWTVEKAAAHSGSYGHFKCAGDADRKVIIERSRVQVGIQTSH